MSKVIVACLAAEDLPTIQQLAVQGDVDVVAVAFDLGTGVDLRALHESTLAAGAVRCHALDLREAFARECVLPALHADSLPAAMAGMHERARAFVATHLAAIATFEGDGRVLAPPAVRLAAAARPVARSLERPAHVALTFDQGLPRAVNGIDMSFVELLDSLGAIGAAHGISGGDAAIAALYTAHSRLRASTSALTGVVQLVISRSGISDVQPDYATA